MPYDISRDYVGVSDGHGGVRLIPRPHLAYAIDRYYQQQSRTRTTDALPNTTDPKTGFKQATKPQNTLPTEPAEGNDSDTEDQLEELGAIGSAVGGALGGAVGLANAAGSYANEDSKTRKSRKVKSRGSWDQLPGSARPAPMKSQSTGPGYDEEDPDQSEKVVGQLPHPGEGMTYRLDQGDDGGVRVVHCLEDGGGMTNVNSGDNRHSWSDRKTRQVLTRMNKAAKAYHFKDAAATQETTMLVYFPGKSQRLELRQDPDVEGKWMLCLISPTADLTGEVPKGSEDFSDPSNSDEDEQRQGGRPDTPETGELRATSQRRMTGDRAPMTNKRLNEIAKSYWSRGRVSV